MEIYENRYQIGSMEVDNQGHCRPSALQGFLQEAAVAAAECSGFGRETFLSRYGAVWVVVRAMFRLDRPLRWQEELTLQTWHRGSRGAVMYRDFDLLVDGKQVGEAVSAWVLMHLDTEKLEKLSRFSELSRNFGESRCKGITLSKIRPTADPVFLEKRSLRYSDTDMNGHVNNTRYADFACDALRLDRREEGSFVSRLQVGYLNQCWPGEELSLYGAGTGEDSFVVGKDQEGKDRFEAILTLDKGPSVK